MKDYRKLITVLEDTQKKVAQQAEVIAQQADQIDVAETALQEMTKKNADKEAVIRFLES
jgi:hypothetical protein